MNPYRSLVARLLGEFERDEALRRAVGGSFIASGKLQHALLLQMGLRPDSRVVDVGCGCGRLAVHLSTMPGVRYLGTDVVPELLERARTLSARPDWRFVLTSGEAIPEEDGGVPHIPIDEEVVWDDGRRQNGLGDIGHSVAVLAKVAGAFG
jgi:SAM-dependent methyltransferase